MTIRVTHHLKYGNSFNKTCFLLILSHADFQENDSIMYHRTGNDHKHGRRENDIISGFHVSGIINFLWLQKGHSKFNP